MKIRALILITILAIAACNKKDKPVTDNTQKPDDSTSQDSTINNPTAVKDTTIKFTIDTTDYYIGTYDSIFIPITISRDTGLLEDVVLTVSDLSSVPLRARAELVVDRGKLPITTTLKIYTYMVELRASDKFSGDCYCIPMTITATTQKTNQIIQKSFNLHHTDDNCWEQIYDLYLKSPKLYTYDQSDNLIDSTVKLHRDPNGHIYCSNLPVKKNPVTQKWYRTIANHSDYTKNYYFGGPCIYASIDMWGKPLATDGVDTISADTALFSLRGWMTFNSYSFRDSFFNIVVDLEHFGNESHKTKGKLIFD